MNKLKLNLKKKCIARDYSRNCWQSHKKTIRKLFSIRIEQMLPFFYPSRFLRQFWSQLSLGPFGIDSKIRLKKNRLFSLQLLCFYYYTSNSSFNNFVILAWYLLIELMRDIVNTLAWFQILLLQCLSEIQPKRYVIPNYLLQKPQQNSPMIPLNPVMLAHVQLP